MKLMKSVTIFLKKTCSMMGIVPPDRLMGICIAENRNADRHISLYMKDVNENERIPDMSVGWKEEIQGQEVLFDETWFLISEEELRQYELYGMFYVTDGSLKGDWEIVLSLDNTQK